MHCILDLPINNLPLVNSRRMPLMTWCAASPVLQGGEDVNIDPLSTNKAACRQVSISFRHQPNEAAAAQGIARRDR